jgi:MFS family permease
MTLYLTNQLGFSVSQAGRMLSLYGIGSLFGAFLGGVLTDKIGHRMVQVGSLFFTGVGFILLSFLNTSLSIAIMLFALALVGEAFRPAVSTGLAEFCPEDLRPRGYALLRLAINLGMTIGPGVGGFLAAVNYSLIFWADGITCLIAAGLLAWFFSIHKRKESPEASISVKAKSPWYDGIFLALMSLLFISGLIFVQLFNTWPIFLRESYGLIEHHIGILLAFNATLIVLFEMPVVHLVEKREHLKAMAAGALLLGIGFGILPFGSTLLFAAITVSIWTLGEMLTFPLLITIIANRSTDQNRGKYMGLFNLSFSFSFVVAPIVGTWIFDHWSSTVLWALCGFLGILMFVGYLLVGRRMKCGMR